MQLPMSYWFHLFVQQIFAVFQKFMQGIHWWASMEVAIEIPIPYIQTLSVKNRWHRQDQTGSKSSSLMSSVLKRVIMMTTK